MVQLKAVLEIQGCNRYDVTMSLLEPHAERSQVRKKACNRKLSVTVEACSDETYFIVLIENQCLGSKEFMLSLNK